MIDILIGLCNSPHKYHYMKHVDLLIRVHEAIFNMNPV